ncbi:MAG TPA: aldo/keto reductase [Candidatus Limnocylindrales bacterium]|jgi:aryl-alcohol dehydrogenase-like predicted oxidoreductase|nr:aldo/keto reductase [Candidatus Limnocylindrales bacterium]
MKMRRRKFLKLAAACAAGSQVAGVGASDLTFRDTGLRQKLRPRSLGKTGVEVSSLALGGVIGMQLPPSDSHDPVAIAETALDLGISYFDTSPDYNNGQSETNYGQVLARRRKEVFLATKTNDRTYDGTMRSIEQSLKRLRTERVDLLQIHGVSAGEDLDAWGKPRGVIAALHKLRDEKVIRFIGLTGHESAARLQQAIERYEFDTLLTTLNPVARRQPFREDLLPMACGKRMGIIAMKVMGGGNGCLVTGNPLQQVLRPYHDQTAHQVKAPSLLRYTLGLPVSIAVVGVATIEQLKANIEIVRSMNPMTLAERQELETAMA